MEVNPMYSHLGRKRRNWAVLLLITLSLFMILAASGCAQESEEEDPLQSGADRSLVVAASDDLRSYSYDPASILYLEEEEGKERIQVFVRVDYPKSNTTVVAEEQLWVIRISDLKYMVTESVALDQEGEPCPT